MLHQTRILFNIESFGSVVHQFKEKQMIFPATTGVQSTDRISLKEYAHHILNDYIFNETEVLCNAVFYIKFPLTNVIQCAILKYMFRFVLNMTLSILIIGKRIFESPKANL